MLIQRLQFRDVFPEEEKKDLIDYLKKISKSTLEETISFLNKDELPNYDNFFSNKDVRGEIISKVQECRQNKYTQGNPVVFSTEANLYIVETIIANKKQLLDENTLGRDTDRDTDRDELNMFKSVLWVNEFLNQKEKNITSPNESNMCQIAQAFITLKFSTADLGLYDDIKKELHNLLYASFYKLKELINFLEQGKYNNYLDEIYNNFNVANQKELLTRVAELYVNVVMNVGKYGFFEVEDYDQQNFLDSLIAKKIKVEDDFINIRNYPVYKKTDGTYIVLNPFFIMDKFTISLKFFLAKFFGNNIQGEFSNFYNKDFSEKFLMYNLFDSIFDYKYFVKKKTFGEEEVDDEPDYYFRYNNKIFIFEYKDILINKNVKVSRNIEIILSELKKKLLQDNSSDKGIGQLVKHINNIDNNHFPFDDRINTSKSLKIYPILVLSDRKLEILGINYQFNQWFRDELGDLSHKNIKVQDLVVMSLDSFIVFKNKFKQDKENFRKMLDRHITEMKKKEKYNHTLENEKKIQKKLLPFSARFINEGFADKDFKEMFEEYC
ncbi:hypothetical protein [Capnocytophaga ochracea]|uniref:Uncharacterized protein n=1 Tax=Capnocytophaga ochracea TaxID=1018 RepID=A0A2X2UUJ6_CAPOC|nr:hypothetical protein [Capnocytophaga ochracea]SQA93159.1 Uncharacterised protein [Capnocytophaga ochracea]